MEECVVIGDSSDEEMVEETARPTITVPNLREETVTPTVRPVPEMPSLAITYVPTSTIPSVPTRNNYEIPVDNNVKTCKDCSTEGCNKIRDAVECNAEVITSIDLSSDENEDEPNDPPRQRPSDDPKTNMADAKPQPKVTKTIDVTDNLDLIELKNSSDKASQQTCSVRTEAEGPVCGNAWCTKPATICPEEHIRDYYNLPTDKDIKVCNDCVTEYYEFKETAQRNIETNGDVTALTVKSVSTCFNLWCKKPASNIPSVRIQNYYEIRTDKNVKICEDCIEGCNKFIDAANSNTEVIMPVVDLSSLDEQEYERNDPLREGPTGTDMPNTNKEDHKLQPGVIETFDLTNTLDFIELNIALEKASQKTCSARKAKGPVCCNSWCMQPATICPEEHIRDYYNIPAGKNFKLCDDCVAKYYKFKETANRNIEANGDLLEGWSTGFNEFVVLDDESDEEDNDESESDMKELLEAAVKEAMKELDQKYDWKKIFRGNVQRVCGKLEHLREESKELLKRLDQVKMDLYQDYDDLQNVFKPPQVSLPDLDIPYSQEIIFVGGDDVAEVVTLDGRAPDTLPPYGELNKPIPKVGDTVFAIKEYTYSKWIPFRIVKIVCETYTVKTSINGSVYKKVVSGDQLAYTTVADVRLGIGSRVLGAFIHNRGTRQSKHWYSGMVAELPTSINQFRYLVFFDDGKVQYCPHEDLRVVYKTSKKIHEYLTGFNVEFVQSYLSKFPERTLVKTDIDHMIRVEVDGRWIFGKVDMLDCSLVHMTFASDRRSEWVYRGSPRLRPVFEDIQADLILRKPRTNELHVINRQRKWSTVNSRLVQHSRGGMPSQIIIDSSDEEDEVPVAKISAVGMHSQIMPLPMYLPERFKEEVKRTSVVCRYPPIMKTPKMFCWHKCSSACVTWIEYSEEKTKGVSPLAIPSLFAFKRDVTVTGLVQYTTPCGKKLQNFQDVLRCLSETLTPLTLDMFDFDVDIQIFDEFVVNESFVLMEDISYGEERNPIACVNEIDKSCPESMTYVTERRPQEGVHINLDPGFLVCCDCTDNCRNRSKCRCSQLTVYNFMPFNVGDDNRPLTEIGYQYQRLDQPVISGIYECSIQCACNKVTCINRVAQHAMSHKLQLFKTTHKGWGVRSLNDIPQGVFISTYVGNILTESKGSETGTIDSDQYFAELDHIEAMESTKADYEESPGPVPAVPKRGRPWTRLLPASKRMRMDVDDSSCTEDQGHQSETHKDTVRSFYGLNETVYVVDSKIAGNVGRYYNHSCDPNIFVQNVYVDTHDLRFPWLAFFALRRIPAGTELTVDYGYRIGSVPGKVLYCYCGSSNCRKRVL